MMKKSLRLLVPLLLLTQLNSCYIINQGYNLLKYNFSAKPLDEVYQDPKVNDKVKERIKLIYEIRNFAFENIGLKQNKNYTKYVELNNQDYLVNVVVASKPDKLEAYQWSFPFFGSFPYKGFYNIDEAKAEAERLKKLGYDTYIRKAGAFSTLGWFDDPIFSFMLNYSTEYLANLIIHEMTHATVFIKDNIQFNEELASFIGDHGAVEFLKHKYGEDSQEYKMSFDLKDDSKTFSKFINEFHNELNAVFNNPDISKWEKIRQKRRIIEKYKTVKFDEMAKNFKAKGSYAWFPKMEINNAVIMGFITYEQDYSLYERLYHKEGKDIRKMIEVFRMIERDNPADPKGYLKKYVENNQG